MSSCTMVAHYSPEVIRSIMADDRRRQSLQTHPTTPPFKCSICHFSFPKEEEFNLHYQQYHQASGQSSQHDSGYRTPIACEKCARAKTKCDKKIPCGRCARRNLECQSRPTRRTIYTDTRYDLVEPRRPQSSHYDARWAYMPAPINSHDDRRRSIAESSDTPLSPLSTMSSSDIARSPVSTMSGAPYHSEAGGYMAGAYQPVSNGYTATPMTYTAMAPSTVPRDMASVSAGVPHYAQTSMAPTSEVQYAHGTPIQPAYMQPGGVMYEMPAQNDQEYPRPVSMTYDMYSHTAAAPTSPVRYSMREGANGHAATHAWPYYYDQDRSQGR